MWELTFLQCGLTGGGGSKLYICNVNISYLKTSSSTVHLRRFKIMLIVLHSWHKQSTKAYISHLSDLWEILMLTLNRCLSYVNFSGSSHYMDSKSCIMQNYKADLITKCTLIQKKLPPEHHVVFELTFNFSFWISFIFSFSYYCHGRCLHYVKVNMDVSTMFSVSYGSTLADYTDIHSTYR